MKRASVLLLVALLAVLTGCSRGPTQSSEVGVEVEGYVMIPTDPSLGSCIPPETNKYLGAGDDHRVFPAGLRNYVFDSDDSADHAPLPLTSSDDATMGLVGYVTFRLIAPRAGMSAEESEKACETFKRFYREIGSKTYNGVPGYVNNNDFRGWQGLLDQVLGRALETVTADLGSDNAALAIYKDKAIRNTVESTIRRELPAAIKTATDGGEYFQLVDVSLAKPEAPPKLVAALNDGTVATQENANATLRNATVETKYEQITDCKNKGIAEQSCVLIYAINEGNVPMVPQGTGVSLPQQR